MSSDGLFIRHGSRMRVLVTGAAGFLGSHLVEVLLERGESVRALVRPGEVVDFPRCGGVEVCRGDLGDRASLEAAVSGVDRVLHCGARTGPWGPQSEYEIANVRGLQTLLQVALAAGVGRFVHVSSVIVLGTDVGSSADEAWPLRAEPNPYSWSKIEGERLLNKAIREQHAPVTIVRPGLVYGPRDVGSFGRFAALIQQGKMVLIGTGDNHLPLIYVRDVAEGIVLASQATQAIGRTYILVNDEPVTQREYLSSIAAELGVQAPGRRIPYGLALSLAVVAEGASRLAGRRRPPPLTRFGVRLLGCENRFAISRARNELGFSPQINVAEGVRRGVAWYRQRCRTSRTGEQL